MSGDHPVVVDEAAALAALDAIAAEAPAVESASPETATLPAIDTNAWQNECRLAASFLAHKICPNWNVPPDVQDQWAVALAECANQLMPGGLANLEKWGPWAKLLFATATWAMVGFDFERFGFKPLTPQPKAKVIPIRPTTDDEPPRPSGGGFSTAA